MQVFERVTQEIDPEGGGLSYTDFESICRKFPDFFFNMRMAT